MANPQQANAIEARNLAFYFHIIQSEQITMSNDITDNIVEDHTVVQDHITIKPLVFTMRGLISEKFYEDPRKSDWNQWIENISNKLTPLKVLMPTVNSYFQSAINAYEAIENKIEQVGKWWETAKTLKTANWKNIFIKKARPESYGRWAKDYLQYNIIDALNELRINRIPVTVKTGWGAVYEPSSESAFYITDIQVNQDDSYQQSELSVTVKELRFTTVQFRELTGEEIRSIQQDEQITKTITGMIEDNRTQLAKEYDVRNNGNN